jgi:adenosylmethionine-8-amino-7-oxononanoate aminotransferase
MSDHVLYPNLAKQYTTMVKGEGVYVFDEDGKRYLDGVGGVGAVNIGHGVGEVIQIITNQLQTLAFTYGGEMDNQPRQQLASKLQDWCPAGMGQTRTWFASSGAEANEAALKLAYQYHWERGEPTRHKIVGRWQSYHGNSIGALSMSGRTAWRSMHSSNLLDFPHIPPPYCYRCPWNLSYSSCGIRCAHELERVIKQEGAENIAAFIAEPVIGTSMSAVVPPAEYYPIIRDICDTYGLLLIVDEVMSGVGRTGEKWGIDHWAVIPDMITSAKGISSGYAPLSALILRERIWRTIADGSAKLMHSTTYSGNPVSCAAGLAVLNYIEEHDLVARAGQTGEELLRQLRVRLDESPHVGDVRGRGLFIGIELVKDKKTKEPFPSNMEVTSLVVQEAFERGLLLLGGVRGLFNGVGGDHFEILPPYIIEDEHLAFIIDTVEAAIAHVTDNLPND